MERELTLLRAQRADSLRARRSFDLSRSGLYLFAYSWFWLFFSSPPATRIFVASTAPALHPLPPGDGSRPGLAAAWATRPTLRKSRARFELATVALFAFRQPSPEFVPGVRVRVLGCHRWRRHELPLPELAGQALARVRIWSGPGHHCEAGGACHQRPICALWPAGCPALCDAARCVATPRMLLSIRPLAPLLAHPAPRRYWSSRLASRLPS